MHVKKNRSPFYWLASLIVLLGAFYLSNHTELTNYGGDNALYLPTAQAFLDSGSLHLEDAFAEHGKEVVTHKAFWTTIELNGHEYNYFPLGNSLFSIPFVWLGNQLGLNAYLPDDSTTIQKWMCSIVLFLVFLIFQKIANLFFETGPSILLAFIAMLGSSMASVAAGGMWSHNLTVLFIALTLYQLLKMEFHLERKWSPWLLGMYLFMAYLCRPAAASFVAAILTFFLVQHGRRFHQVIIPLGICMGILIAWSYSTLGSSLPPYYLPKRLGETGDVLQAFQGHLWSPSRGILTFSPIFLLSFLGILFRSNRQWLLFWCLSGAYLLHLILLSRFIHWWGGWSYGPRLQTDMIPLLFVLALMALDGYVKYKPGKTLRRVAGGILFLFTGWSVFVHVPQGALNPEAMKWNGTIDQQPEYYLFNWDFPQFLAGYYPEGITLENANFQEEIKRMIPGLKEGDKLYIPKNTPNANRLAKLYNQKNTFPGIHIQVDRDDLDPLTHPTYVTLDGKAELESEGKWRFEILGDSIRMLDLFDNPEYPLTFILGNYVSVNPLSKQTRNRLSELESEILDHYEGTGWVTLIENGRIQKEVLVEDEHVEVFYIEGHTIKLWSTGTPRIPGFGVLIDGQEVAARRLGFTVVQYNFETNQSKDFFFEPKYGDIEGASLFKVIPQ